MALLIVHNRKKIFLIVTGAQAATCSIFAVFVAKFGQRLSNFLQEQDPLAPQVNAIPNRHEYDVDRVDSIGISLSAVVG